jgi:hypothetical protein
MAVDGPQGQPQQNSERQTPFDTVQKLPHIRELWALQEQFATEGPRGRFASLDAAARKPLYQAAQLLAVAIDHLVALELLVRAGAIPTWAPFSVLRPAVEAAHRASWLLEVDGDARIGRGLAHRWEEATEELKDNAALLKAAGTRIPDRLQQEAERLRTAGDLRRQEVVREAAKLGVPVAERPPRDAQGRKQPLQVRTGARAADVALRDVVWVGEPYPKATELLKRLVDAEPGYGPMIYRRLSSTIHGRPGPTRPVTAAVAAGPDEDGYIAAQHSVRIEELQMASYVASTAAVSAAMSLADATGYCRHRVGLAPRQGADGTVSRPRWWPPSDRIQGASVTVAASCSCCRATSMLAYRSTGAATEVVWCMTCPPQHPETQAAFRAATGHRFPART